MVKIIAGNWKMNGVMPEAEKLIIELSQGVKELNTDKFEMVICPPFTLTQKAIELTQAGEIIIGAQDCHTEDAGAFTGNISAQMLENLGCKYVLAGHSERRQYEGDTNQIVNAKALKIRENKMMPIICIGETEEQKVNGMTFDVLENQIKDSIPQGSTINNVIIAYEPVWAIGTGKVATIDDIKETIKHIRKVCKEVLGHEGVKVLYGGSVNAKNSDEILGLKSLDGVLVGGAALKAKDFLSIAKSAC